MNKNLLLLAVTLLPGLFSFAQNVGINADGSKPNPNAMLDIKSRNKGLLIPRMDSVARNAIPNTEGLLVYDVSTDNFWYNTGKEWRCLQNDKDRGQAGNSWLLKGNGNTVDSVDFIGTTNYASLNIRVDNTPAGRIDIEKYNTFWGYLSGLNNRRGITNTGIGMAALQQNLDALENTAVGYYALNLTQAPGNTATGHSALGNNTTGYYNTADGDNALAHNVSGLYNTASGYESLLLNIDGYGNVANGAFSLRSNTDGSANAANGYDALMSNTTGNGNTANGYFSGMFNTTGNNNSGNGRESLYFTNTGSDNTASGFQSLYANRTGNFNTVDGDEGLYFNTSGSFNTSVGAWGMSNNNTGSNNTTVGYQANVSTDGFTNATAIGNGAIVDASNKVRIGNGAVTVIEGQVPFTTPSDGRYKFNIEENVKGLDFIMHLRPVTYQFDVKRFDAHMGGQPGPANYALQAGYDEATRIRRSGFIAQEVEQAANASGYDFSGIIKPKTEQDHYSLSYDAFVVPLVKAVQEQQQVILQQNKKLEEQDKKLVSLQAQLDELKRIVQSTH